MSENLEKIRKNLQKQENEKQKMLENQGGKTSKNEKIVKSSDKSRVKDKKFKKKSGK